MKKVFSFSRHSVTLLLAIFLIFGCNKEEHQVQSPSSITALQKKENPKENFDKKERIVQEVISCFDEQHDLVGTPKFTDAFGEITAKRILYISNEGFTTYIFPLKKEGIDNLLLITEENSLHLLQKTTSLSSLDVIGTPLSPYLSKIFDIEGFFLSTDDISQVEVALSSDYIIQEEGEFLLLEEKSSITGVLSTTSTGKLNELCEDAIEQMLPAYANFFGLPLVEPFDYSELITDAITACHPSGEYCVCPIPTCVLEELIPNVTDPDIQEQLEAAYASFCANLDNSQQSYLLSQPALLADVGDFMLSNGCGIEASAAVQMMIELDMNSLLYGPYEDDYFAVVHQYQDNEFNPYYQFLLTLEIISLRIEHQSCGCPDDWSDARIYMQASYNVFIDELHLLLDLGGLVPGFGEVADITNGVIYTLEGDGLNATLSFSSTIPFVGWGSTGVKWARMGVTTASGTQATLKFIVNTSTNIVSFGNRSQLKRIIKPSSGEQVHHIIPWEWREHPVVQAAAKAGEGNLPFHMNDHVNGIAVSTTRHNGSHNAYNTYVFNELETILQNSGGSIDPSDALNQIVVLSNSIRTTIVNNPTTHINSLF